MQYDAFCELISTCAEAQRWRPLSDRMMQELYGRAIAKEDGIGEDAVYDLVTAFLSTPNQTPAHLLQAIREEKLRQFKARSAVAPSAKSYGDMSDPEKDSYVATVRAVRQQLTANLATLGAQGRIATTRVAGFSSVSGLLAGEILETGLAEMALEKELAAVPIEFLDELTPVSTAA